MDAQTWFHSLMTALVGGAATAGSAWAGINLAGAAGAAVPTLNIKALGIIMLAGAVTNLLAFLKQSPIPTTISKTQTIVTKEVTQTDPKEGEEI